MHVHIQQRIESVLNKLNELPSIPDIASKVLDMANNPEISFKAIADEISKDQAITTNILKLCNSAFFSKGKEISSIDRAIVTLGIREVKDIVVIVATKEVLNKSIMGYDLAHGELWKHGVAVAALAKKIAIMKNKKGISDIAFTGGIIHDVGKTVLAIFVKNTFNDILNMVQEKKIAFNEAEKEIMGYDHQEIGEKILSKWKFPEILKAIVRYHHEPEKAPKDHEAIVSIVHIANALCLMAGIGIGNDGLYHQLSESAISTLGINNIELEQLYSNIPQTLKQTRELL